MSFRIYIAFLYYSLLTLLFLLLIVSSLVAELFVPSNPKYFSPFICEKEVAKVFQLKFTNPLPSLLCQPPSEQ